MNTLEQKNGVGGGAGNGAISGSAAGMIVGQQNPDMDDEMPPFTRPTPPPPGMWTGPDVVRPMPVLPDTGDCEEDEEEDDRIYYRVQVGAFSNRENAEHLLQMLLADGLPAFMLYTDDLYKVQVGAFLKLTNAINMERRVRELGYSTYITT